MEGDGALVQDVPEREEVGKLEYVLRYVSLLMIT